MVDSKREDMMAFVFDDAIEEDGFAPEGFIDLKELDRGGMSVVYSAQQIEPPREVALKIILPKYVGDDNVRKRFQREGEVMARLDHPSILPIYQIGEWDGLSFIAMKMASGGNLQEVLERNTPTTENIVDWLISAGDGIHFAHQAGVLHRDLKPSNLLFDHTGAIFVADFGVAKITLSQNNSLTMAEALIGTPHYLAPEVAAGEVLGGSVATDQYGLGTILYQCLTGRRPYEGKENLVAQLREIVEQELVGVKKLAPNTPKDLCVICEKAMAKNPSDRYRSVIDFVEDLKLWRSGLPITARPTGILEKYWMWTRRYPLASVLSLLLIFTLVMGSILFVSNYKKRGELLFESLLERAKSERLVQQPSFRVRAIDLLYTAREIKASDEIQHEAVAVLGYWDVGEENFVEWLDEESPLSYKIEEMTEGLILTSNIDNQVKKIPLDGVLRCPAICSADGKLLAFVKGEDIEMVIYDVNHDSVFSVIPIESWPVSIHFSSSSDVIKVVFEDEQASLYSLGGDLLLRNFHSDDHLAKPVGLSLWRDDFVHSRQTVPYGVERSPDQKYLATTSARGVIIWNSMTGKAVDYYETGNQRIDSPTDAWWLDNHRLLVQVPGAQEIIEIDELGYIIKKTKQQRVPGSVIKDIFPNGDWHVEVRDEDGSSKMELWKKGNFNHIGKWVPRKADKSICHQDGVVSYNDWKLTLPGSHEILKAIVIQEEEKVIVLTNGYDIYEWDLRILRKELEELGFLSPKISN